jgi:hypothetical protein
LRPSTLFIGCPAENWINTFFENNLYVDSRDEISTMCDDNDQMRRTGRKFRDRKEVPNAALHADQQREHAQIAAFMANSLRRRSGQFQLTDVEIPKYGPRLARAGVLIVIGIFVNWIAERSQPVSLH